MTVSDPLDRRPAVWDPEQRRREILEALSWYEDMDVGRWGADYAREVLEAHEAHIRAADPLRAHVGEPS